MSLRRALKPALWRPLSRRGDLPGDPRLWCDTYTTRGCALTPQVYGGTCLGRRGTLRARGRSGAQERCAGKQRSRQQEGSARVLGNTASARKPTPGLRPPRVPVLSDDRSASFCCFWGARVLASQLEGRGQVPPRGGEYTRDRTLNSPHAPAHTHACTHLSTHSEHHLSYTPPRREASEKPSEPHSRVAQP